MKHRKFSFQNILKPLLVVTFLVVAWFTWEIYTDKPPHFFPLSNTEGTYTVTKNCPNNQGWDEAVRHTGNFYCVEYKGPGVFMYEKSPEYGFYRITVGHSDVDLAQYLNSEIKNIVGTFNSSSEQCIMNVCAPLPGNTVVLDIESFEN